MAAGNFNIQKASGGVLNVQPADGTTTTSLVLPAINGTVVAADSNGNVCIGTSSPVGNLDVFKTSSAVTYVRTANQTLKLSADDSAGKVDVANAAGTPMSFTIGTTERMRIDTVGNVLLTSGTGGLGYGTGSGGTVTQLTSKSTSVTLNKPSGYITTNNSALASGQEVTFTVYNNLIGAYDNVFISPSHFSEPYDIRVKQQIGQFNIIIKNILGTTQSDYIQFNFAIIKGSNS